MGIIQKVSKWIGNFLSGDSPQSQDSNTGANPVVENNSLPNSVEIREKIKKSTLLLLNSLYLTNSECCKSKRLAVWVDTDKTTFNSYVGFEQDLASYWAVESGYEFEKIELKYGKPEDRQEARKVNVGVDSVDIFIQELNPIKESIVKKARISIFGNKGSLVQEQYELSSEALKEEHRNFYNIGRGEIPEMEDGSFRRNHIAIDDKNNLEVNRYVSRAHARIGFSETIGFYLQVEFGGSRLSGNRTRIFRGEEKIEIENVDIKEPLQNGDLIELGKAVILEFVEIK